MADTTQLRVADRGGFADDDPFAELTRIMGFDPREPARQPGQAPASAVSAEAQSADIVGDDFGIDLEKELMGEFGLDEGGHFDAPHYPQPEQSYAEPAAYQAAEPAEAYVPASREPDAENVAQAAPHEGDAFREQAYDAVHVQFEPVDPVVEGYASEAAEHHMQPSAYSDGAELAETDIADYAPEADEPTDAAFDDAIFASMEDELTSAGDWVPAEPEPEQVQEAQAEELPVAAYEPSFEPAYEPVAAYERADVSFEEPASARFDEAVAVSPDDAVALDGDWQPAQDFAPQHAVEPSWHASAQEAEAAGEAFAEPSAYEAEVPAYEAEAPAYEAEAPAYDAAEAEFADDFDAALAEVDMDFTAVPLASSGGPSFEPHADVDQAPEVDAWAVESEQPAAPQAAAPSLEDELNALLGNMAAPLSASAQPISGMASETQASAVDHEPSIAAMEDAPLAEVADEIDFALSDEDLLAQDAVAETAAAAFVEPAFMQARSDHGYARGNFRLPESTPEPLREEASYSAPVEAGDEAVESFAQAFQPEASEAVAENEPEFDLDFDDDAFDAAFARSIDNSAEAEAQPVAAQQPVGGETDPYAELAALTASFKKPETGTSWQQPAAEPVAAPQQTEASFEQMNYHQNAFSISNGAHSAQSYSDYPEIETIDVPEQAVALADDLDIPELTFEEDVPVAAAYDDLDAEFAGLLNDMATPEPVAPQPAKAPVGEMDDFVADFEREFQIDNQAYQPDGSAYPVAAAAGMAAAAAGAFGAAAASRSNGAAAASEFGGAAARSQYQHPSLDQFDYDPDAEDDAMAPAYAAQAQRRPQRRGTLIAAVIGGVVVLGGIGAFALSGGGGSGTPAIIKADQTPVKVRPENPGGAPVPNQDNKVYDTVGRTPTEEPTQQRLVTTAEKPIDMAAQEDVPLDEDDTIVGDDEGMAPAGKSEDRIQQAIQDDSATRNTEVAAVTPRKVRTMVVKSDGTLVPREDPAPAVDPATTSSEGAAAQSTAAAAHANEPKPAEATAAPRPAAQPSSTPASVAIAPSRPSDQPVNVVGEVKPDKVAALTTNAGAAGEWAMQIASQPTEAAAQSSYQDLLRRYGNVLNGHPASIVKAEIAGKGTFYRVRVPAPTRNDAITLCESYKAAGGNCFVSK